MVTFESITGTYEIIGEIGVGGGGTVYKAFHKRLQKDVVIKKIHEEVKDIVNSRAETDILKNLRHSYLPQVLDFLEIGNDIYTVMDYIPGKSFGQHLEEGTVFTQKQIIKWGRQLSEALEYLHSQTPPIIHSDIKPANIMLTPLGDICLIDFNISSVFEEKGVHPIGFSDGYSPPEQYPKSIREKKQREYIESSSIRKNTRRSKESTQKTGNNTGYESEDRRENFSRDTKGIEREEKTELFSHASPIEEERTELFSHASSAEEEKTEYYESSMRETAVAHEDGTEIYQHGNAVEETEYYVNDISAADDKTDLYTKEITGHEGVPQKQQETPRSEPTFIQTAFIDERSDIYSLGATLYQLISGQKPACSLQPVTPLSSYKVKVSDGFLYIINKSMEKQPNKRFHNVSKLKKAFNNLSKLDKRYKRFMLRQEILAIVMVLLFALSTLSIYFGKERIYAEKVERYDNYIVDITNLRIQKETEDFEQIYKTAVNIFPERLEAYYQKVLLLYELGQYEENIEYIKENRLFDIKVYNQNETFANIYFVLSNCYFELEEYESAVRYYKEAILYYELNSEYYRDYAIALAKLGRREEALEILERAIAIGMANDSIYLAKGEIDFLNQDYLLAEKSFLDCIGITNSNYILNRAYIMCSKVYEEGGAFIEDTKEKNIALLEEATVKLPLDMTLIVNTRLAEAYVEYGTLTQESLYYEKAIHVFTRLVDMGWDTYSTHNNLSLLYRKLKDYEKAYETLYNMLQLYGENYNTYKRLAYLEIDIEGTKENSERDYTKFKEYYEQATDLYASENKHNKNDTEMDFLQNAYQELEQGNWFE